MWEEFSMIAGSSYIPKTRTPPKPAGEDAHFFNQTAQIIGVADGVGSWAKKGVDAGEYARELMRNAEQSVKGFAPAAVDPKSVIAAAFSRTKAAGSSTACILSLAGNRLRAANVGDSGFMVIRGGKIIFRSPVQLWSFNTPYKLERRVISGPELADEMAVEVEGGDVVVAATDGLFDNLFPGEVEAVVDRCLSEGLEPEMVACELARAAYLKSTCQSAKTPFAAVAAELGPRRRRGGIGGKRDDITVVVAFIIKAFAMILQPLQCNKQGEVVSVERGMVTGRSRGYL
ncbi:probable protein phosphatase 2C 55 [Salvia hispanica]|uniref:probable protein phosphatase 2C 55 n=1 Tax=Salvia hispanica TaxID=49212 RepID=UPI0020092BDB|nr:probable protein phosphatase 2C 55 [Salvia hispanica]